MGHYDDCYAEEYREQARKAKEEFDHKEPERRQRENELAADIEALIKKYGVAKTIAIMTLGHLEEYQDKEL